VTRGIQNNMSARSGTSASRGSVAVLRLLLGLLVALTGAFSASTAATGAATTAASAATYTYDSPASARVDVDAFGVADASPAQLSGAREGSASTSGKARRPSTTPVEQSVATEAAGETTRVGRWMSQGEFDTMSSTGKVVEGAGGRTYVVVEPPNPGAYRATGPGSVYAEFDVPTGSLRPAAEPAHAVIPGPNVTTKLYGPPPAEMPNATCIVWVCRK
jgi:hypothetical protein